MKLLPCSFFDSLSMNTFVVSFLVYGAYCAFPRQTAADDISRTPIIEKWREIANLLSSATDDTFRHRLHDLQLELLRTNYQQLLKDASNFNILLENSNWMDGNFPMGDLTAVDPEDNNTTPLYNLTTDLGNTTAGPYSTFLDNITTTESSPSNATTPNPAPAVDMQCVNHTAKFLEALGQNQPWALQMVDADGKPSPNIADAQLFWVGDFEECIKVKALDNSSGAVDLLFKGRYCTAVIPLQPLDNRPLMPAVAPTGIRIGLCMPDSCSSQDITLILNDALARVNSSFRVGLTTCQQEKLDYDTKAVVVLFICSMFLLVLVLGTVYDLLAVQWPAWATQAYSSESPDTTTTTASHSADGYKVMEKNNVPYGSDRSEAVDVTEDDGERTPLLGKSEQQKSFPSEGPSIGTCGQVLLAFSMYTNGKKIMDTCHTPSSITCIHGIRFLSITWVILGHTFAFGVTTAENYVTYVLNTKDQWTFQAILGGPVAVDTFFSLSGLLVAYLILKDMDKRDGKVQWFLFYFHRFWRLTPPYMFVMMMLIALFRYLGSGPNWPQEGTEVNSCQNTWWTNLLYVNNFVRVEEMCMNWSWYLANDMQFYVISPLLFVPLFRWRKAGLVLACLWLLATMTTAGILSTIHHFPPSISVTDNSDMMEGANYFFDFYIKPYCRFGPYVVGMLTGYALFITKSQVKMNLVISLSGWAVATAVGLAVVYGLYEPTRGNALTNGQSAFYNAASHTAWGVCVCWVIFACATGHGGPVNTLLSWNAFIPLSRLTYMTYLVHPIIMNLYHLGAPSAFYMSTFHFVILFLGFTVVAFGSAFLLSLAFEAPMMALEKVLLPKPKH